MLEKNTMNEDVFPIENGGFGTNVMFVFRVVTRGFSKIPQGECCCLLEPTPIKYWRIWNVDYPPWNWEFAPENGWLEYDELSFWGKRPILRGELLVSGRVDDGFISHCDFVWAFTEVGTKQTSIYFHFDVLMSWNMFVCVCSHSDSSAHIYIYIYIFLSCAGSYITHM